MLQIPAGIGEEVSVGWGGSEEWCWRRLLADWGGLRLLLALVRIPAGTRVAEAVAEIHSWTLGGRLPLLLPRQLVGGLLKRWQMRLRAVGLLMHCWKRCESSEPSQSLSSGVRLKWEEN